MSKFKEYVLAFIKEQLANPQKIVFLGSMGEASYSGATKYEGAFFLEDEVDTYKEKALLPRGDYCFYELDGKYSEVEGDPIEINFNSLAEAFIWYWENDVSKDSYLDYLSELYENAFENNELVLKNEEEILYHVSPLMLSDLILINNEWEKGVFNTLSQNFKPVTTLVPRDEL